MDISGTARRLVDVPRKGVSLALEAPQHVNELLDEVTQVVRRASRLLDRADLIAARLEHKLDHLDTLADRVGEVAEFTDGVAKEARSTRQVAEEQLRRVQRLLDTYQPLLESLAPVSREAVLSLQPAHVRGLAALLDELPALVDRIKPALDGMSRVGPDLEHMADHMDTVSHVVEGLPGANVLRRRGKAREEGAAD